MRPEVYEQLISLRAELVDNHKPCSGTGYLEPENPGELNPCKCMRVHSYLCGLIESKIPRDYWWLNVDDLEVDEKFKKLSRWFVSRLGNAVENGLGLLFMGTNGIGKTSMQCAIGKEAVVAGYTVQYYTAQQYIEACKSKDPTILTEYESAQIILLDELDKVYVSKGSDFVKRTLEDYLRRMTSEGKSMIICTNGDADYLAKTFGDSTLSALQRHLKFTPVTGTDFSETLQNRWKSLMDEDKTYFSPEIVDPAERRAERILEEDRNGWQTPNS